MQRIHPQKWLRYSLFAVLYPSGITGELFSIVSALDKIRKGEIAWKFLDSLGPLLSYYRLVLLLLPLYAPGSVVMYSHMLKQRRKVLSGGRGARSRKGDKKKTA